MLKAVTRAVEGNGQMRLKTLRVFQRLRQLPARRNKAEWLVSVVPDVKGSERVGCDRINNLFTVVLGPLDALVKRLLVLSIAPAIRGVNFKPLDVTGTESLTRCELKHRTDVILSAEAEMWDTVNATALVAVERNPERALIQLPCFDRR